MFREGHDVGSRLSREVSDSLEFADRIIKVQGNVFIKELLRQKKRADSKIRIGSTKDDIVDNLRAAIEEGRIRRDDIEAWIRQVEGWGRQHVYLHHVSPKLAGDAMWRSESALRKLIKREFGIDLGNSSEVGLEFPAELQVSSASYSSGGMEVIWRKRFEQWNRDKTRDSRERIDDDLYEFRAFRQELSRAVTRFVLKPAARVAALFVQIPLSDVKHAITRDTVNSTLDRVFPVAELKPVNMSNVIKGLDQEDLNRPEDDAKPGRVVAQNTKFGADGASVLFEADPGNPRWKRNAAVRGVRRALNANDFSGDSATFQVQLRASEGLERDVMMSLNGKDRRAYLHAQMTSDEVWFVLDEILRHSR
jgi:hypothetical protein